MADAVGAVGFVMLLLAFGSNAAGRMSRDSYSYAVLNVAGSGILAWYALVEDVPIFFALEIAWAGIALATIVSRLRRREGASP